MPLEIFKNALNDLFIVEKQNTPILMQLTKHITKGVCEFSSPEEALEYLVSYMDDIHTLLNKRHITRDLLFKYIHSRSPSTKTDFTKSDLIKLVIRYWHENNLTARETKTNSNAVNEDKIDVFAQQFAEWFFNSYNGNNLNLADFWDDINLYLRIHASDNTREYVGSSSETALKQLMECKLLFNFYFNPNLTHEGVQARTDPHGLNLVLVCGTLHANQTFVGVFEIAFGLLRDPFASNNWKIKKIKCVLRSKSEERVPKLTESDSLRAALTLSTMKDSIT